MELGENQAQKLCGNFVAKTISSIEADRQSIAEKEKQTAEASSSLSSTKESQLSNDAELESLNSLLTGLHAECDCIIKYYFDNRQKFHQEERTSTLTAAREI